MKTKTGIDVLELRREEMQDYFSDHIDFSDKAVHSLVGAELLSKEKKISNKERYQSALKSLKESTNLENVNEIITFLESRENTPFERESLRILKQFH